MMIEADSPNESCKNLHVFCFWTVFCQIFLHFFLQAASQVIQDGATIVFLSISHINLIPAKNSICIGLSFFDKK